MAVRSRGFIEWRPNSKSRRSSNKWLREIDRQNAAREINW
jgi:hypothetical protein